MKWAVALVILCVMTGCADIRKSIITLSKEDLKNAETSRKVAINDMETWSLNSGFIQCGLIDQQLMPPAQMAVYANLDALVKQAGYWDQEDYTLGCYLGLKAKLDMNAIMAIVEFVQKYIPK